MKFIQDTRVIVAISIIAIVLILEIGKSIRINQLKKIEDKKIESMSQYEEKSKNDYLKPLSEKLDKNKD